MVFESAQPAIRVVETEADHGEFVVEPLPRGYGHTIGNPLRRVLLSSLDGAAITRITVDGVLHEFSELPYMREDVTQFILNLKNVRLRLHGDGPVNGLIEKTGPGVVTDSDIQIGSEVEIVNPDHYLATLDNDEGALRVELVVERGVGYKGAEEQMQRHEIGVIPIDARYTPVTKVQYVVENARVGQATDFDRLVLNIWTDGAMRPEEAISQASQILVDSFSMVTRVGALEMPELDGEPGGVGESGEQVLPIEDLRLSNRALNCLKRHGIETVDALLDMTEQDLRELRGMGVKLVEEIREQLAEQGLQIKDEEPVAAGSD
ncbi:MAG: DNA-directed RNA polymerase subunit alpha [Chloroflexi bacterium]|nr:DNA-directed RNA polymerase subunit alpha [Chloroflexota bacterium]